MPRAIFQLTRLSSIASAAACCLLCSGCAVYPPAPALYADGTPVYPATPYATTPYYASPYYAAPYYVGPPVSLDLWFGHYRGWGGGHYRGGWHGPRGFHGGHRGRH